MSDAAKSSEVMVSSFPKANDPHTVSDLSLADVMDRIRGPELELVTDTIRERFAIGGKPAIKLLKERLPGVTFSGTFSHRAKAGLRVHSGLVSIDLDGFTPEQLKAAWAVLVAVPWMVVLFRSPSGVGLKGAVRVDGVTDEASHLAALKAVTAWLASIGLENDPACKDSSRLAFLAHDPGAYYNPEAESFDAVPWTMKTAEPVVPVAVPRRVCDDRDVRKALAYVAKIQSVDGQRGSAALTTAMRALRRFGLEGAELRGAAEQWNAECAIPPWSSEDLERTIRNVENTPTTGAPLGVERARQMDWVEDEGGLPQVILPSVGPDDEVVDVPTSARAIGRALRRTGRYFLRGRRPHSLEKSEYGEGLCPLDAHGFVARVPEHCRLFGWRTLDGSQVLKPIAKMSVDTALACMASLSSSEVLPEISSVLRCPGLIERDGDLVDMVPGYNPERGGVYVTGTESIPSVEIGEALECLRTTIADFDFVTPSDRSRALACIITPALRFAGLIPGHVPIAIVEADKSQTGKTFLQTLVAAVYGESLAMVVQKKGGVGSLDETLSQMLINGRPFIMFDNTRGKIDSTLLEAILTPTGCFFARVPHRVEVEVDPRRFIFGLTSNGAELTRDLANRASIIRIRKRPASYRFRKWRLRDGQMGDVLAYIQENQARMLGSVHAIVRHWYRAGRPSSDVTSHDFRAWAGILDWILTTASEAPLMDGHDAVKQRVGDPGLAWLRAVALTAVRDSTSGWSASRLAEAALEHGIQVPNARPDADESSLAKSIGLLMRRLMSESETLDIDGIQVSKRQARDGDGRPRNEYVFTPKSPEPRESPKC